MNTKIINFLGLCKKAGKLSCGHDASFDSLKTGKAKLILLTSDASERLVNEFKRSSQFEDRNVPLIILEITSEEIEYGLGRKTAVFAVNDSGFATKLAEMAQGGNN